MCKHMICSPDRSPGRPVGYSASDLKKLWFYVTPSGKKLAEELSKNWKLNPSGFEFRRNEMSYSDKVIDHYNNPRNVGSMDK